MKRNIILGLAFGVAGCFSVFAEGEDKPVYDETNGVGYDTFEAAFEIVNNANDDLEATWIITGDVNVNSRSILDGKNKYNKVITIKGKDNSSKLINNEHNNNNFMLGMKGRGQWIFENIIIDGGGLSKGKTLIEVAESPIILKNVKIQNYECKGEGLFLIKNSAIGEFENVTFENCTGNFSYITVNKEGFKFSGVNILEVHVADGKTIDGEGLEDGTQITVTMENPVIGSVLVENCTNPDYFIFNHEGYELQAKDGNLIVADDVKVEIPTDVTIEGKAGGYHYLEDALLAAVNDDVILINKDQVIEDYPNNPTHHRVTIDGKNITIKGGKENAKIRSLYDNQAFIINKSNVTFEGIIFDGGDADAKNFFSLENNSEVTLKNVHFVDHRFGKNSDNYKFIHLKNGNIHLDGVTVENINGPEGVGMVNINKDGSTFKGVNNISIHLNGKTTIAYVGGSATRAAEPMKIYIDQHEMGDPIVTGAADPNTFSIAGKDKVKLISKDGNLVLAEDTQTGIEELEENADAPVEYFNLQGMKVSGDLTPGIYVRRQGSKASKVIIK